MSNTPKIDELILDYTKKQWVNSSPYHMEDLKAQLLAEILKVIGEDEQPHNIHLIDKNTAIFLNNKIAFCNGLRAEQRTKLEELFNIEEK